MTSTLRHRAPVTPMMTVSVFLGPDFQMVFQNPGRPEDVIVLGSSSEIAMALNLSGAPVTSDLPAQRLARLAIAGVRRAGVRRVQELTLIDRMANVLDEDVAPSMRPEVLKLQRRIWPDHREEACTGAASALVQAVKRGHGLVVAA
ncbi:hypothetical protein FXN61_22330 [Lentzea sp. PSKA42]|uniref:Uncharacterized protein n=1 Tax=Lentzea indica TaxID=2604800 RepID=A0ABX1FKP9_9PSEU|nr:hypothetical protein [Lentzea indica]NKE59397.1 hypothetical protein [Lentzea indica]